MRGAPPDQCGPPVFWRSASVFNTGIACRSRRTLPRRQAGFLARHFADYGVRTCYARTERLLTWSSRRTLSVTSFTAWSRRLRLVALFPPLHKGPFRRSTSEPGCFKEEFS